MMVPEAVIASHLLNADWCSYASSLSVRSVIGACWPPGSRIRPVSVYRSWRDPLGRRYGRPSLALLQEAATTRQLPDSRDA
jgi:hypothetical protein